MEADIDCFEPKTKVTLYLDASVAKMFRAMGKGYQARINRILQLWLQSKMGGMQNEAEQLVARRMPYVRRENQEDGGPGWGPMVD